MPRIHCTRCDDVVRSEDVELATRLAKCACGNVFDITSQLAPGGSGARRDLARPTGWTMETVDRSGAYRVTSSGDAARLVLTRSWRTPPVFAALAFAVTLDGFLAFWYATLVPQMLRPDAPHAFLLAFLLFPLLFVAVAVWHTYSAIAQLLNRTTLHVEARALTVRHRPLPWPGQRQLSLEGVRGFFVRQSGPLARRSEPWAVLADTSDSAASVVLERLSEADARFVAARLAAHFEVDGP